MSLPELVNDIDSESASVVFRNAEPFPHIVLDDFLERGFAEQVARSIPDYSEARSYGKEYKKLNEHGKIQVADRSFFKQPVSKLDTVLSSTEFLDAIEEITGIETLIPDPALLGGGIHLMKSGSVLDVHVDFNLIRDRRLFRRLNILLFFNKHWESDWGGQLELWDENVQRCVKTIEPLFNRCVLFATSEYSYHGVRKIRCPKSVNRVSYAGYYYTSEPPPEWDRNVHTTLFKPRPGERIKGSILIPIEKTYRYWARKAGNLKKRVMNTNG